MTTRRLDVVLVRPIYARNVGMCARAIANMGAGRLLLVQPTCALDEVARQGAAGAQRALTEATTYASLADFYSHEGEGLRIAFSARASRLGPPLPFDQFLLAPGPKPLLNDPRVPVYLLFGPEDDGLSAAEIEHVHHVCSLPTFGDFSSLNLSHAVLLTLYMIGNHLRAQVSAAESIPAASESKPRFYPSETIDRWVAAVGFHLEDRRVNAAKIFHRILLENQPSEDELRILEAILQQNIRKLAANQKT